MSNNAYGVIYNKRGVNKPFGLWFPSPEERDRFYQKIKSERGVFGARKKDK